MSSTDIQNAINCPERELEGLRLAEAIWTLNHERLQAILQAGANPNKPTPDGSSPLTLAAKRGSASLLRLLLEAGADPNLTNSDQKPALIYLLTDGPWSALLQDRWECVRLLLKAGAQVTTRDEFGNSMIEHAWEHGYGEALTRLMLELDIKPIIPEPNIRLISAVRRKQIRQVQSLLQLKISPDIRMQTDQDAATPLMLAAQNGDYDTCQLLIAHGANPTLRTQRNQRLRRKECYHSFVAESTALEFAVNRGIYRVVQLLLMAGALPTGRPSEDRLLSIAKEGAREDLVSLLEEHGYGNSERNPRQIVVHMSS